VVSRAGVIVLAIIGAALVMTASGMGARNRISEQAANRLSNTGYAITGLSILMFLYLGFTEG